MSESPDFLTASEFASFVADGRGFQRIYIQYVGLVQFVVRKFLSQQHDIDDVVQEVFTRLYRDRASIEKPQAIKSWLAITARHLCIDILRRKKNETVSLSEVQEPAGPDPGDCFAREVSVQIVRDLLVELAQRGEAVELKMFYLDEMKVAEIARQLGVSVSAVTTNLTRQRRKYGEVLKERLDEPRLRGVKS